MSLINDALKRAQTLKPVSPNASQPIGLEPTQPIFKRSKPMSASRMVMTLGIVMGSLLIIITALGIGFYVLYLKSDEPTQMVKAESVTQVPAPASAIAADTVKEITPTSESSEATAATIESVVQEVTPVIEEEPAPWVNNPYPEITEYVNSITIIGTRTSNGISRALMNNKVYKTGEIVNRDLGLKLTAVSHDQLVFEDAEKNIYTAHF
ncbi:MAG: hypothetical protein JKY51_03830 [Opitutaceae bacterium]|nr:hypothetical protein [Opitutaceae bacterium]